MSCSAWSASVRQSQLQMAAAVSSPTSLSSASSSSSSSSSMSVQAGVSFVAASSALLANTQSGQVTSSACRRILSSTVPHAASSTESKATSTATDTAPTQSAAHCPSSVEQRPFYGHILTKTLLQSSSRPQRSSAEGMPDLSSSFLAQPRDSALSSTSTAPVQPVVSSTARSNSGNGATFVRVISTEQGSVMRSDAVPQRIPSLPPSPQKGFESGQVGYPPTDCSLGSCVSSSCLSPDNFLAPSPQSQTATSPASVGHMESPDTTEQAIIHETDSGYSDNLTDKSASPDKPVHHTDPANTSSATKRKRVRKSRAKQQDPEHKIIVKKTRRMRANDRERSRMHGLNDAMDELRKHLPHDGNAGKLTKIDTLRTASNYIKVLKMMLGEMEKGEDLSQWSADMMTAVNSLYVQPAASPDSTGVTSPGPLPMVFEDGQQLHGTMASGAQGDGHMMCEMPAAPFPGYPPQGCLDSFDPASSMGAMMPCGGAGAGGGSGLMAGGAKNAAVCVLGDSSNFPAPLTPMNNGMSPVVVAPYRLNGGPVSGNSGYCPSPQYAVNGHYPSTQNMFLQSSQCY